MVLVNMLISLPPPPTTDGTNQFYYLSTYQQLSVSVDISTCSASTNFDGRRLLASMKSIISFHLVYQRSSWVICPLIIILPQNCRIYICWRCCFNSNSLYSLRIRLKRPAFSCPSMAEHILSVICGEKLFLLRVL